MMLNLLNQWYDDGFIDEELNWTAFATRFARYANPKGLAPVELAKEMLNEKEAA